MTRRPGCRVFFNGSYWDVTEAYDSVLKTYASLKNEDEVYFIELTVHGTGKSIAIKLGEVTGIMEMGF